MRGIFAIACLAVVVSAGETSRDLHEWSSACSHEARRFAVRTNTFPEISRSLALHLDATYERLEKRFGPLPEGRDQPMRVLLFRSRQGYYDRGGGVRGALGHFDASLDRSALIWDGRTGDEGWPIAVHESCHHYFRRRFPGVVPPTWYGEGIACYFEGLLDLSAPHAVARLRLETARGAVVRGTAGLEAVLLARADVSGGWLQLAGFTPTRYYALAWSFVHYLESDGRLRAGLRRFEKRYFAAKAASHEREKLALGILTEECGDLETLEAGWRRHVESLPHHGNYDPPEVSRVELQAGSPFSRYRALRRLHGKELPDDLRADVLHCLNDRDVLVRTAALRIVARRMAADAVDGLLDCIDFGDPELKRAALRALAHPAARAAVPRLVQEVGAGERELALRALASVRTPRTWRTLRRAVADRSLSYATRARCAAALGEDRRAKEVLTVAAQAPGDNLRTAARTSLRRLDELAATRPASRGASTLGTVTLTAALRDDPRLRRLASRYPEQDLAPAEGLDAEARAAHLLLAVARSPQFADRDRADACRMLGERRTQVAVPVLRGLCRPRNADRVRLQAIRALIAITGELRGFRDGQSAREREAAYRAWQN